MRLAIVGGGIVGLASAWYLARAGVEVIVLERDAAGRGASWAAGGMLCANIEHESDNPRFAALAGAGLARWPGFADSLEAATGRDVGLSLEGTLVAAFSEQEELDWRAKLDRRNASGGKLEWLSPSDMRARAPGLTADLRGGVFSPADGMVDNRAVMEALVEAVEAAGVTLREGCEVQSIESHGGRVSAVITAEERFEVDGVVLAAGAWSGQIAGLPEDMPLPMSPVRGQMAAVAWEGHEDQYPFYVIWGPDIYCIPRADGRLVLGATSEEAGFDPRLTAGGLAGLLTRAARVLPEISNMPLLEAWSGFRPAVPDRLPVLGHTSITGLTIATGHFRNGILLAPVTAELVADLALGRHPRLDISAFSPQRFVRQAVGAPDAEQTKPRGAYRPRGGTITNMNY